MSYRFGRKTFWTYVAMGAAIVALSAVYLPGGKGSGALAMATLIAVPRLHDIGRSGWWAALMFSPALIVMFALLVPALANEALEWVYFASFGAVALGFAVLGLIPGHAGSNRFGEPRRSWL